MVNYYGHDGKLKPLNDEKHGIPLGILIVLLTILATYWLAGCVTIPKETALLSVHLGNQISESKRTHIALIEDWAEQRRQKAEAILKYHWAREFIKRFLNMDAVKKDLAGIVCNGKGEMDRAIVIQEMVEDIAMTIQAKRSEWIDAIEAERRALMDAAVVHYTETERMHRSILANVQSVTQGQEIEQELRKALTKPINRIVPLDKASDKLDELIDLGLKEVKK